jgi:hypothetical protein
VFVALLLVRVVLAAWEHVLAVVPGFVLEVVLDAGLGSVLVLELALVVPQFVALAQVAVD